MKNLTLFELHQIIQRVFYLNFEESIWVEAEISESRVHGGHIYMTLIEKNPTGQILAKANCTLWRNKAGILRQKLGDLFSQVTRTGNKIKALCRVEFHPQYGYSLHLEDFDPAYTEGYLYLEKKRTIERLQKEELFDLNKTLEIPLVIRKVAIISSSSAAGYQDFVHQLSENTFGYQFHLELFQTTMQGDKVSSQLEAALETIGQRRTEFDIIVVVRGGGASVDLSDFDSYEVAAAIARSPLPVVAGIGHERDTPVAGMVAHSQVKTPTAAAELIIGHNYQFENDILQTYSDIRSIANQRLQYTRQMVHQWDVSLTHLIRTSIERERLFLQKCFHEFQVSATNRIATEKNLLEQHKIWIIDNNPFRIMNRGYAMVFQDRKRILDLTELDGSQAVELVMGTQKITINE